MNQQPEHHTRKSYPELTAALADAERVVADLCDAIQSDQALFLDRDALDFLARRARVLVSTAHRKAVETN